MRARIITAVTLLVALALGGAGALVYAVEAQRLEDQSIAEIDQELDEFTRFTQRAGGDVGTVLRSFLRQNVPDGNEILVAWYDGRPRNAFPSGDPFVNSPEFTEQVSRRLDSNGTYPVEVPEYGASFLTIQQVSTGPGDSGALVIVTYLERGRAELRETMQTYAIVSALALLMITAFGAWQSGRLLAPLRTLRETAGDITTRDLSRRIPERGSDDISALTRTINDMLDRLESGFNSQRQFLDDAGHELKTPLTVLRGHLELLDQGDAQEVAETRALLLDEVDRMSRLVGDLILLAKSARPDFLSPRPVDVGQLTHTLVAKARGLGDRQWAVDQAAEVTVTIDEQRITQALLQLADNAVKHTGDGDPVAVGSSYDVRGLRVWVRDTGPGVPPADRGQIFERFGRSAVPAGDEGFGLGLSIVRAIARAHGGDVAVEDAEPTGARFVITLPPQEDVWPAS